MFIEPSTENPHFQSLRITHIFLGRLEKPKPMDVFVKQSAMAPGLSSRFTKSNGKMWVKDRLSKQGMRVPFLVWGRGWESLPL